MILYLILKCQQNKFLGLPLGFGVYFWLTVYSTFAQFRGEETAKMVRSAIRPEGVNNTCGGNGSSRTGNGRTGSNSSCSGSGRGQPDVVTTLSTAETEETEVCSTAQSRPSLPISNSSPTFSNVKDQNASIQQRTATGSPPPAYEVGL